MMDYQCISPYAVICMKLSCMKYVQIALTTHAYLMLSTNTSLAVLWFYVVLPC